MRPEKTSPTAVITWILLSLLLVFVQLFTSLVLFAGVFIYSNEVLISPFRFCLTNHRHELSCDQRHIETVDGGDGYKIKINTLKTVVILCLYIPLALVAFALLSTLLAGYARDRAALWFSTGCQAASSLLILTAVVVFLWLNHSYVSWEHMTLGFYTCVCVHLELGIISALTFVSGRRLTYDWQ